MPTTTDKHSISSKLSKLSSLVSSTWNTCLKKRSTWQRVTPLGWTSKTTVSFRTSRGIPSTSSTWRQSAPLKSIASWLTLTQIGSSLWLSSRRWQASLKVSHAKSWESLQPANRTKSSSLRERSPRTPSQPICGRNSKCSPWKKLEPSSQAQLLLLLQSKRLLWSCLNLLTQLHKPQIYSLKATKTLANPPLPPPLSLTTGHQPLRWYQQRLLQPTRPLP